MKTPQPTFQRLLSITYFKSTAAKVGRKLFNTLNPSQPQERNGLYIGQLLTQLRENHVSQDIEYEKESECPWRLEYYTFRLFIISSEAWL